MLSIKKTFILSAQKGILHRFRKKRNSRKKNLTLIQGDIINTFLTFRQPPSKNTLNEKIVLLINHVYFIGNGIENEKLKTCF